MIVGVPHTDPNITAPTADIRLGEGPESSREETVAVREQVGENAAVGVGEHGKEHVVGEGRGELDGQVGLRVRDGVDVACGSGAGAKKGRRGLEDWDERGGGGLVVQRDWGDWGGDCEGCEQGDGEGEAGHDELVGEHADGAGTIGLSVSVRGVGSPKRVPAVDGLLLLLSHPTGLRRQRLWNTSVMFRNASVTRLVIGRDVLCLLCGGIAPVKMVPPEERMSRREVNMKLKRSGWNFQCQARRYVG